MAFVWFILIGIAAGWLAGQIMKGSGSGLLMDLVIGVVGAVLGGFVFRLLGLSAAGLVGQLVVATVGAVLLLFLLHKLRPASGG